MPLSLADVVIMAQHGGARLDAGVRVLHALLETLVTRGVGVCTDHIVVGTADGDMRWGYASVTISGIM